MEDLLGANIYHNINTYALGTYAIDDPRIQYDLNNPNGIVREGDKFGYNYDILVNRGQLWTNYVENFGALHYYVAATARCATVLRLTTLTARAARQSSSTEE